MTSILKASTNITVIVAQTTMLLFEFLSLLVYLLSYEQQQQNE